MENINYREFPWITEEIINSIPPQKLEFLCSLFQITKSSGNKSMITRLLPLLKEGKSKNLTFSKDEQALLFQAMKRNASKEQLDMLESSMNKIINMQKNKPR